MFLRAREKKYAQHNKARRCQQNTKNVNEYFQVFLALLSVYEMLHNSFHVQPKLIDSYYHRSDEQIMYDENLIELNHVDTENPRKLQKRLLTMDPKVISSQMMSGIVWD